MTRLTTIKPHIRILTRKVTHTNGQVFEVCYAVIETGGCFYTKILGVRPYSNSEIEPVMALSGGCQSSKVEHAPIISPLTHQFEYTLSNFFLVSQPTRAPNM